MEKKETKRTTVKPSAVQSLKEKMMAAVHKVLKENKSQLTSKIQKVVNKSVKKIVKKTDKQLKKALASK